MDLRLQSADPLRVLSTTQPVVLAARHVTIDPAAISRAANQIGDLTVDVPEWGDDLHFRDGTWRTAGWVLALDALNFCFWSVDPDRRWRVDYGGELYDGYWALVAALRRAVDEGVPLWDADFLAALDPGAVATILRPAEPDGERIPLLDARHRHLAELGEGLLRFASAHSRPFPGAQPVESLLAFAGRSAVRLIQDVIEWFPSFDDVAAYEGREVRFYKRAQILAADLNAAFQGEGDDLDQLTAFADYKVPQVLRRLGVLVYDNDLARRIDAHDLIPAGSPEEVEIRAATIWACELIRQERAAVSRQQAAGSRQLAAHEIDFALWQAGQTVSEEDRPYHRTLTVFY